RRQGAGAPRDALPDAHLQGLRRRERSTRLVRRLGASPGATPSSATASETDVGGEMPVRGDAHRGAGDPAGGAVRTASADRMKPRSARGGPLPNVARQIEHIPAGSVTDMTEAARDGAGGEELVLVARRRGVCIECAIVAGPG